MSTQRRKQAAQEADRLIMEQAKSANPSDEGAHSEAASEAEQQSAEATEQLTSQEEGAEASNGEPQYQQEAGGQEEPPVDREETADYWKHKFKSLDGILRQRDGQIEQMRDMLASMQQSMQTMSQSQQAAPAESSQPLVSKEDEDAFGADLVDLIQRVARQELGSMRDQLRSEYTGLQEEVSKVATTVKQTAKERFEASLDKHAKGWRELDSDPAFIEWLRASPSRQHQWGLAVNNLDHVAVADMFETYKLLNQQAAQAKAAPSDRRRAQLEKQVAPGRSKSSAKHTADEGAARQWTASEIAHTFDNRKSYAAQEWAALEREIFKAQAEGRVDYSK